MHVEFNDLHEIQSAFPYLYVKYSISEFHSMNRTFSGREDDRNALSCRCILIALKLFLFLFEIGCYGLPEDDLLSFGTLDGSSYSMIFKVSLWQHPSRTEACLLSCKKKKIREADHK